jgi:pimeloyl-ACP methyl ester carboxylesterase
VRIDDKDRRFVEANGLRVGYDVVGAGPPLVLLHGASSSGREDFGAQLPRLAGSFTCYLPDARGADAGTRRRPPARRPRR